MARPNKETGTQQARTRLLATALQRVSTAKWFATVEIATITLALFALSRPETGIAEILRMPVLKERWILLGTYAVILAFPAIRGMQLKIVRLVTSDTLLLGIGGLAALSILWSTLPAATFRDVISLALTVVVAAYLSDRFDARTLAALMFAATVIAASLSVLLAIVQPESGLHAFGQHTGTLRGLYEHKNPLGRATAIGAIPGTLLVLDGLTHRRWWTIPAIFGQALIIAVLWLSDSRTAQVSLAFGLMAMVGFALLRRGPDRLADVAGGVLAVTMPSMTGLLISGVTSPVSTLLGRSETMLARLRIWSAVFDALGKRYWLGLGFESFWVGGSTTRQFVETTVGWSVSTAHNGYIDIVLGMGLVGLLLFSAHLIRTSIASARLAQRTQQLATLMPITFIALAVTLNLAESRLLAPGTLLLVVYLVCSFWTDPKNGRYGQSREML